MGRSNNRARSSSPARYFFDSGRALVGRQVFLAHQGDAAVEFLQSQCVNCLRGCLSRAPNDDVFAGHGLFLDRDCMRIRILALGEG